jgi:hypothetical protein
MKSFYPQLTRVSETEIRSLAARNLLCRWRNCKNDDEIAWALMRSKTLLGNAETEIKKTALAAVVVGE